MNAKIFYKTILLLFYLSAAICSIAQTQTTVKTSVDKNKILIGEPIILKIEVNIPINEPARFPRIDSIPHFEFLEKQKIDTSIAGSGSLLQQVIRITSFDSGHWVIPSFTLSKNIKTDTIPIDVGFSKFDPNQDYHDIKDIIEVHPSNKKNWLWYAIGGILVLILLLVWFLKRKIHSAPTIEVLINPYEEAMRRLDALNKKSMLPKQYYSELIDILRLYLFRKKGILSLQKTTDDLIMQLDKIDFNRDQYAELSQALRLSDFVKFAKYVPSEVDNRNMFETIKNSITILERTEAKISS